MRNMIRARSSVNLSLFLLVHTHAPRVYIIFLIRGSPLVLASYALIADQAAGGG